MDSDVCPICGAAGPRHCELADDNVLGLRVGEAPDFIHLDPLGLHVPNVRVVIGGAGLPGVDQEFDDCVLTRPGQPRDGADRLAFAKEVKDARAVFSGKLVHALRYNDPYA